MKKTIILLLLLTIVLMTGCSKKIEVEKKKDLNIKDYGWTYIESDTGNYVSYGLVIDNICKTYLIISPTIKIIGKDKNDNVIFSLKETLPYIAPSDTTYFGKTFKVDKKPDKVDITIEVTENDYVGEKNVDYVKNENLKISDVSEEKNENIREYKGKVKNNSDIDLSKMLVSIIYRKNKKIVGGSYSYVYPFTSKDALDFDIYAVNIPEYDEYEVNVTSGDNIE